MPPCVTFGPIKLPSESLCVSHLEEARLQCTSEGLVAPLVDIMSSGNNDEVVQACRALGNMCFDNGFSIVFFTASPFCLTGIVMVQFF